MVLGFQLTHALSGFKCWTSHVQAQPIKLAECNPGNLGTSSTYFSFLMSHDTGDGRYGPCWFSMQACLIITYLGFI